MATTVLETQRLRITYPDVRDAARMARFHLENLDHLKPWSPPIGPESLTEAFWTCKFEAYAREREEGHAHRFVLYERVEETGPVVGTIGLSQIARGPFQACYLGYQLGVAFEGKGLMTEALKRTVEFAFNDLHLHRIMANYAPTNERSGRVLKRLGFVVEGYARDYLFINGEWRDHVLTALSNPELTAPIL